MNEFDDIESVNELNDSQRETLIEKLTANETEKPEFSYLYEIYRHGFKGFQNFTDVELINRFEVEFGCTLTEDYLENYL